MANELRLTTLVVERAEDLEDTWEAAIADGQITPREAQDLTTRSRALVTAAAEADEAIGLGISLLRRGPESTSFRRRLRSRELRLIVCNDEPPTAA